MILWTDESNVVLLGLGATDGLLDDPKTESKPQIPEDGEAWWHKYCDPGMFLTLWCWARLWRSV